MEQSIWLSEPGFKVCGPSRALRHANVAIVLRGLGERVYVSASAQTYRAGELYATHKKKIQDIVPEVHLDI